MAQAFAILRFQNALVGREGPDLEKTYRRVIDVLSRVGAQWSVVGAHAVNVYVEPRATVDVNFVVEARKMKPILRALEEEFGTVETTEIGAAVRVTNLSIDLIRGDNHPLFRAALDEAEERQGVRVPPGRAAARPQVSRGHQPVARRGGSQAGRGRPHPALSRGRRGPRPGRRVALRLAGLPAGGSRIRRDPRPYRPRPGRERLTIAAEVEGNYPSKGGIGEKAVWFRDSEGNLLGVGQAIR